MPMRSPSEPTVSSRSPCASARSPSAAHSDSVGSLVVPIGACARSRRSHRQQASHRSRAGAPWTLHQALPLFVLMLLGAFRAARCVARCPLLSMAKTSSLKAPCRWPCLLSCCSAASPSPRHRRRAVGTVAALPSLPGRRAPAAARAAPPALLCTQLRLSFARVLHQHRPLHGHAHHQPVPVLRHHLHRRRLHMHHADLPRTRLFGSKPAEGCWPDWSGRVHAARHEHLQPAGA